MHSSALRALEFDRIAAVVSGLAVTPTGQDRLLAMYPLTDAAGVAAVQRATTEGTQFLAEHPGFPLRVPADLDEVIATLSIDGADPATSPVRLSWVNRTVVRSGEKAPGIVPDVTDGHCRGRVIQG